jgi:phenylalanyl-tRNA synthetase alpha chain
LITQIQKQLEDLFLRMGFDIMIGSDLETGHYQFDTLQYKKEDSAREKVYYVNEHLMLRSSPASLVVRALEKRRPPVKVFCAAKCYHPMNAQDKMGQGTTSHCVEALWIDRGLSSANLKALSQLAIDEFFGKGFETRTQWATQTYTRLTFKTQVRRKSPGSPGHPWVSILTGGLVDTAVLQEVDYDPEIYSGFVLGLVIEPIAMLKYGIEDVQTLYQNDVRFLEIF